MAVLSSWSDLSPVTDETIFNVSPRMPHVFVLFGTVMGTTPNFPTHTITNVYSLIFPHQPLLIFPHMYHC